MFGYAAAGFGDDAQLEIGDLRFETASGTFQVAPTLRAAAFAAPRGGTYGCFFTCCGAGGGGDGSIDDETGDGVVA